MFSSNGLSPSDVALLSGNNNGGFGDFGGGWAWLLIILFMLGGWGGGFGWGGNASTTSSIMDNYVLTSDFASLESRIDTVNANLCSGLYTQSALINGVNQNVSDTGFAIQNAITQDTIANMQNANALGVQILGVANQIQQNGCDTRSQIADLKYTLATEGCATRQSIADGTRAIIDKINSDRMQVLEDENQALRLQASQQAQNTFLVNQLRPAPIPSYIVSNPYYYGGYGTTIA